jgi:hypothetical protein
MVTTDGLRTSLNDVIQKKIYLQRGLYSGYYSASPE